MKMNRKLMKQTVTISNQHLQEIFYRHNLPETAETSVTNGTGLKLEDLKVLKRSPDLINNVKIGQGFTAYNKTYFVRPYMGVAAILVK